MKNPKFSVILPNYNTPLDRFATYGKSAQTAIALIDLCGKQGVAKGVEMLSGNGPTDLTDSNKKEVKAALENNGLELAGILANTWSGDFAKGSLSDPDPKVRRRAIDIVKKAMDFAAELDCSYVGQWPGQDGWDFYFEVDYQKQYEWWVAGLQELADYNPGIKLGVEPKPYEPRMYSFINNNMKVLLLARDVNRKNVGLTLDIGHSIYGLESIAEAVAIAQKDSRLFHLHINDNYGTMDGDMPVGSVHMIGLIEFFYWLKRTNYSGWYSVDIFAYRTNPTETVLESLRWMQALYDQVDKAGMANLDALIEKGDGVATQRFFREMLLGK
jgi:xylose isomerase